MRPTRHALVGLPLALVLLASAAGAQPTAYSVNSDGDDQLYTINLTTGAQTAIGDTFSGDVDGLAFDLTGTSLYGVDTTSNRLVSCNLEFGNCTAIGDVLGLGVDVSATGLAFGCDDTLYMVDEDTQGLYQVSTVGGTAALIGSTGQDLTALAARAGDATCPSGLFGVDDDANALSCVDTTTGAATTIGPLGVAFSDGGIDFDGNGVLWFLDDDGFIRTINPSTGTATDISTTIAGFEGLAIPADACQITQPEVPAAVPMASPSRLVVLGILLLGVGLLVLRRFSP
jgi:hypothetical protein